MYIILSKINNFFQLLFSSPQRMAESSRRLEETRRKEAVERAQQTLREGQTFLQKTLETRRAKEQEEREREREKSNQRVRAVLSLKKNIESSEVSCCEKHNFFMIFSDS